MSEKKVPKVNPGQSHSGKQEAIIQGHLQYVVDILKSVNYPGNPSVSLLAALHDLNQSGKLHKGDAHKILGIFNRLGIKEKQHRGKAAQIAAALVRSQREDNDDESLIKKNTVSNTTPDVGETANAEDSFQLSKLKRPQPSTQNRVTFPGTYFSLVVISTNRDLMQNYFKERMTATDRRIYDLKPTTDHPSLAAMLTVLGQQHVELVIPENPSFSPAVWLYSKYLYPFYDIGEGDLINGKVPGVKYTSIIRKIISHLPDGVPGVDLEALSRPDVLLDPEETTRYATLLNCHVLIPIGAFASEGPHGTCHGVFIPQMDNVVSCDGLKFLVRRSYAIHGELGEGVVQGNVINLPIEPSILMEKVHTNATVWLDEGKRGRKWPSFYRHPQLLQQWINMNSFGNLNLHEAVKKKEEDTLAEELSHEVTDRFCSTACSNDMETLLMKTDKGNPAKFIQLILRNDSDHRREFLKLITSGINQDDLDNYADSLFEMEAKLAAFERTPLPLITLLDALKEVIIPIPLTMSGEKGYTPPAEESRYPRARLFIAGALTTELIPGGGELCKQVNWKAIEQADFSRERTYENFQNDWERYKRGELKDPTGIWKLRDSWYRYLDGQIGDINKFAGFIESGRLQSAARNARYKPFLTQAERDAIMPSWRERYIDLEKKTFPYTCNY